jgi:hypothetical protein
VRRPNKSTRYLQKHCGICRGREHNPQADTDFAADLRPASGTEESKVAPQISHKAELNLDRSSSSLTVPQKLRAAFVFPGRHRSPGTKIAAGLARVEWQPLLNFAAPQRRRPLSFRFQKESRAGRSFGLAPAFPSAARLYQTLTFYPALPYGVDGDRIDRANFRIIGVGDRGLSGIVYRIKVACVRSKQGRRNAWGARFGKIADAEFHARKIMRQPPISNGRDRSASSGVTQCIYGS